MMQIETINKLKSNWKLVGLVCLGILSYFYYYSYLVTSFLYYIVILVVSILIVWVFGGLFKKILKCSLVECFLILVLLIYFAFFSLLYVLKGNSKVEEYIVPLNGYYTSKIDGIFFSFNGRSFNRKLNLNNYAKVDLTKKYMVKLRLREQLNEIYYIDNIQLVEK